MSITTQTLGYPRIGKNRQVKKALESFWAGKFGVDNLLETVQEVETANWQTQRSAGIDRIGIGDTTLYDHLLDWLGRWGLIPERFQQFTGLERYFAMDRGKEGVPALEMTKLGQKTTPIILGLVTQMVQQLRAGLTKLPLEQIWVNPDCGLKTRCWQEVYSSLENMVRAAKILREETDAR